jgi:hypothetical protein
MTLPNQALQTTPGSRGRFRYRGLRLSSGVSELLR